MSSQLTAAFEKKSRIRSTPALIGRDGTDLKHELQARVRPEGAADLRRGEPVRENDVGCEVVFAADERGADAVGIDGNAAPLERTDLLGVEAPRDHDLDPLEAVFVQSLANLPDEALVDARRLELAHLVPERAVDERVGRVQADPPEALAERAGDLERRLHGVVLEVDEDGDVEVGRR